MSGLQPRQVPRRLAKPKEYTTTASIFSLEIDRFPAPARTEPMKIAVIGAGIVGVSTAYELACDGHEVTVFERHGAAAEECSFANAGVLAPGYVTPWAAPGMPVKLLSQFFSRHAAVRLSPALGLAELRWMWRWWRACRVSVYESHRARLQALAFASRERRHAIVADLQLEYENSPGFMVLLRTERERRQAQRQLDLLRQSGIRFAEIDAEQALKIEPALHPQTPLAGAIHLPGDEVGNCRQFAQQLKAQAQRLGVHFRFGTTVRALDTNQGVRLAIAGADQPVAFDAVVICAGVASARMLERLGISVPLVPVYGYSVSAPLREALNAPLSGVMDERYKVAITRLGQRVRVSGGAQLGGKVQRRNPAALATLYKVLADWFPAAAQLSAGVQEWKGARPMLPDGPPLIGASPVPGVWLNIGHGSSGWALSSGSARWLADQMAGRQNPLGSSGWGLDRLHRR